MKDWQEFEVLVAAVHRLASSGGTVKWDEQINGRQFDVTIRFTHGPHKYLTVIECRDTATPLQVADVEAFITKARGVNADKAVVVSSSGFQSGAITVAQKEGVALLVVKEKHEQPRVPSDAERILAANFYDLVVKFDDGEDLEFPDGPKLQYLAAHTHIIEPAGERRSLDDILTAWAKAHGPDGFGEELYSVDLREGSTYQDNSGHKCPGVSQLSFRARFVDAYSSKSIPALDFQLQQSLAKKWVLARPDGSTVYESYFTDLCMGLWTEVEVGKYYSNPALGFYYRCEAISRGIVTWVLVESYQHGNLFQSRFTAKVEFNIQYIPVTKKAKLDELEKLYKRLRS